MATKTLAILSGPPTPATTGNASRRFRILEIEATARIDCGLCINPIYPKRGPLRCPMGMLSLRYTCYDMKGYPMLR